MFILQEVPYLLLLLIIWLICSYKKTSFKSKGNVAFIILAVFVGCRYGVGWDYWNYLRAIEAGGAAVERFEWIPRQIALFAHRIDFPQLYYMITGSFSMFFIVKGIARITTNLSLSIYIFITFPLFFLNSLIIDRFFLAFSLVFYCSTYLFKDRKIIPFILGILISFNIHVVSIVATLFLIPYYITINRKANIILFIVTFLISSGTSKLLLTYFPNIGLGMNSMMSEKVDSFMNYVEVGNSSDLTKIPYVFYSINIFNLLFRRYLFGDSNKVDTYLMIFNIGCCLMQLFSFEQSMASRFSVFFLLYITLIIPLYKDKNITYVFYIVGLLLYIYALSVDAYHPDFYNRRNCYLPYRTFLNLNL